MRLDQLKPDVIVRGPLFPEPVKIISVSVRGTSVKIFGAGLNSNQVYQPILNQEQLDTLEVSSDKDPFDGDPKKFRLGVEALRLGLAYEYDPYFSLSIARVDPLPHQLEAVYDYFLAQPVEPCTILCSPFVTLNSPLLNSLRTMIRPLGGGRFSDRVGQLEVFL